MLVVGVDLAGSPKNDSGFCVLDVVGKEKSASVRILHSDEEILDRIKECKPDLVAVDAPLTFEGRNRQCDSELSSYGALPVTLKGMEMLALRGSAFAQKLLEKNWKAVEVYATGTAKMLGYYDRDDKVVQKNLLSSGLRGDIERRFLNRDELDAIFCAITGFLYLMNSYREVGGSDGKIIIPRV